MPVSESISFCSITTSPTTATTAATAFGIADPTDWGRVQDEYSWYWDACISRKVGRKIDPYTEQVKGWWIAETDPPTGPMPPPDDE